MSKRVNLLALSFRDEPQETVWRTIYSQADENTDLVLLPELWLGDLYPMDTEEGPVLQRASQAARELNTYLVCPVYYKDGEKRLNSAVVFDRRGAVCFRYDKMYPYWDEFQREPPCSPGNKPGIFQADFGTCGIAVCFDVNFPELWEALDRQGAQLVLWPSDYSAGRALQAHAMTHHYYILSATRYRDTAVYDITGDELIYNRSDSITVTKVCLDLDRRLFHENFNLEKRGILLAENPGVRLEQTYPREQWFVLGAPAEDVNVGELARAYGMEELRTYLYRSRAVRGSQEEPYENHRI